jgi:hypothetical protein
MLPAEVLEAVEPFPDPTRAKSSQRYGTASPHTITPIRLQEECYPPRVSPRTPTHDKAGSLYRK